MRALIFGIWLHLVVIDARSSEKKSYGSVCSAEFTCRDFCQSSEGSKYRKNSKRCNRNAEKLQKKCNRKCKISDCRQNCRKTFQEEISKCPCFDHTNDYDSECGELARENKKLRMERFGAAIKDTQLGTLQDENERLRKKAESYKEENEICIRNNRHLKNQQCQSLTKSLDKMRRAKEECDEDLDDSKTRTQILDVVIKKEKENNRKLEDSLKREIERLKSQQERQDEENERKTALLIAKNDEIRRLKEDNRDLRISKSERCENQADDLEKIKKTKGKCEEHLDESQTRVYLLEDKIDEEKAKFEKDLNKCKTRINVLEENIESLKAQKQTVVSERSFFEAPSSKMNKKHILVMGDDLSEAFSISLDGSTTKRTTITAPSDDYLKWAPHALIQNKLYVFGGETDKQRIAKLDGCLWKEQSSRLINDVSNEGAALTIESGEKALICLGYKCEVFDGNFSSSTHASKFYHLWGKLGFYKGKPATVGSKCCDEDMNKVETLNSYGWSSLINFPSKISHHFLIGLPSGSLLLAGGENVDFLQQTAIWLLQNNKWNIIGHLQHADSYGSTIMIKKSIFISGVKSPKVIERLDFDEDELINQEVIGRTVQSWIPVLFEVSADYCV